MFKLTSLYAKIIKVNEKSITLNSTLNDKKITYIYRNEHI